MPTVIGFSHDIGGTALDDVATESGPPNPEAPDPEAGTLGSVDRFVQLFAREQRRVHAYIGALLPSRTDADDVMQETSIALWRKWSQFDEGRDFFRWACGVAHIEVLRHRRKHATSRLFFNEDIMGEIAEEVLNQSDVAAARSAALAECLQKLREPDRRLVEHRYGAGVTTLQAAADLGRPPSTVYKALARIRRSLMECIQRRLAQEASARP